jgi:hypothetical protein
MATLRATAAALALTTMVPLTPLLGQASQAECPDVEAFSAAPYRRVQLPRIAADTLWDHVGEVLERWHRDQFLSGGEAQIAAGVDAPVLFVDYAETQALGARLAAGQTARTCFVAHRSEKGVDHRVAFWFGAEAAETGTVLEFRWLGQMKGRGERTWQPDRNLAPRMAATLVRYLTQQQG